MPAGAAASPGEHDETHRDQGLARTLLRIVLRDPAHLPENLAVFSLKMLGPGIPGYVSELRRRHPDFDATQLERMIVRQGVRETSREGGFVGGPFIVFVPVAFVAALLAQIKMLLRMAAVADRDPREPQRAAELLVIMGVHKGVGQAAAALTALPITRAGAARKHSAFFATADMIRRMVKLLGLISPAAVTPVSRLVRIGRWLLLGLALVVGMVAPLVWLPYLSMSYYRSTVELAERVSVFYSGPEKALHLPRRTSAVPGLAVAVIRALGSLALILGGLAVFLALDVQIAGREWPALLSLAVLISTATGLVWYVRRMQHRRQGAGS